MPVLGLENWEGVTIGGSDLFFSPWKREVNTGRVS